MAEETKKACCCGGKFLPMLKLALGILIVILGFLLTVKYFHALRLILIACLGPFLILVGLIMVAVSKE